MSQSCAPMCIYIYLLTSIILIWHKVLKNATYEEILGMFSCNSKPDTKTSGQKNEGTNFFFPSFHLTQVLI